VDTINDVISPREEVLKKEIEPTVQAHKIDSGEERIESSAARFLRTTYPSNSIRNIVERANEKMRYKDDQGGFLLLGPYGSGKSHALVALYHLFDNPQEASQWTSDWNIEFDAPDSSSSIIVSSFNEDPDELWVPIFQKAGREDLLDEVGRYPTSDIIEDLIGEDPFAIFFDEIETWWGSFDEKEDKNLKEKNKAFLQNLLEVAKDKNRQLYVFITLLDKSDQLKEILNRTQPIADDVSTSGDKEKIVRHRLFHRPDENLDRDKAKKIVKNYIEAYSSPIELDNQKEFEKKFVDSYPFHPQALEIIGNIYEGSKERQNVRGEMRVLADTIAEKADKTDAILLCDVSEQPFKVIDRDLVGKYSDDAEKRAGDVSHGSEILRSILFYSLEEESGAATEDRVLRATLKPTEGMTVTDLSMSLESLMGRAHYLHKDDGHYQIKDQYNVAALIQKETSEIDDEEAEEKIGKIVSREIFDNQAHIYRRGEDNDHIPDDSEITFVVSLKSLGNEEQTKDELNDIYHGRNYRNTVVFIVPNNSGPTGEADIIEKTKRVIAAENLKNRLEEKKGDIDNVLGEEKHELKSAIKDKYGYWIKWSSQGSGHEVDAIRKSVEPEIREIREEIRTDKGKIRKNIWQEVQDEPDGKKVGTILNDFKKMRKHPLIEDENKFYTTIRNMTGEKVFLRAERGKIYRGDTPDQIKDDFTLQDPDYAPSPEIEEDEDPDIEDIDVSDDGEVPTAELEEEKEISPISKDAIGNSTRVIQNKFENQLNKNTDKIDRLRLTVELGETSKDRLLDIVENLPEMDANEITARVEGERVEDSE
jgi:hypothetical protein